MKKIFLALLLVLLLTVFPDTARAEDTLELNMQQRDEIVAALKNIPNMRNMLGETEEDQVVNLAKLVLGQPIQVYYYSEAGFEPLHIVYPLLYEGELKYLLSAVKRDDLAGSSDTFYNFNENRFVPQVRAAAMQNKSVALVCDCNCLYLFDGRNWQLLRESTDAHTRDLTGAVLDPTAQIDTSALQLTKICGFLELENAYLGRLPRVAPPADEDIAIYLDGERLAAEGWLRKGRVLLPLRAVCDLLDLPLEYADNTQRITLHQGRHTYSLRLNDSEVLRDGHLSSALDVPALEREGRCYLPLRFVAQLFDLDLQWDENSLRVDIVRPEQPVVRVVRHVRMTNETWDMQLDRPYLAQQMYAEIFAACFEEADAPAAENLGVWPNLDNPDSYYLLTEYDFLRQDGSVYASFELYLHAPGQPVPEEYTEYLICSDDKWYLTLDDLPEILKEWDNIEGWQRLY